MMHDTELQKMWVLQNPLNFTRYFFKENGGKRFICLLYTSDAADEL